MFISLLVSSAVVLGQGALPAGPATIEVASGRERLEVFTYKPPAYRDGPMLLVFHGAGRNAEEYRDAARAAGDRFGMLVLAPRFDQERFSNDRYHRGGLIRDGAVAPRTEWTWQAVSRLVEDVRRREGRPDMPYYLFGHSAGAQFLARMAGFVSTDARHVVVANPSAYLIPSRAVAYPYGFGGLPEGLSGEEQLRLYLAQPLTVYLGTNDRLQEDLDLHPDAGRLGSTRFERGRTIYREAEQLAKARGWTFGWTLVEARGVGHDHRGMLDAPAFSEALFGPRPAR